jgi:hypothetical protein
VDGTLWPAIAYTMGLRIQRNKPATWPASYFHDFIRTTPIPICFRSFSGYFERACSASSFDLKGFDRGTGALLTY